MSHAEMKIAQQIHAVADLAEKIMKQCPLCSHGLATAILLAAFSFFLVLYLLYSIVPQVNAVIRRVKVVRTFRYTQPLAQAPPVLT